MKCEDCGEDREDVQAATCPFTSDIYYQDVVIVVCMDCLRSRAEAR